MTFERGVIDAVGRRPQGRATLHGFAMLLVCTLVVTACAEAGDEAGLTVGEVSQELAARRGGIARDGRHQVCWNFPGYEMEKRLVREAIEGTWGRESNAVFYGWGRCSLDTQGIFIDHEDGRSNSPQGHGFVFHRLWLNFVFKNFETARCTESEEARKQCIRAVAIHEFGHALGFGHEQDRSDVLACATTNDNTEWLLTGYDPLSIMNYCSPAWNNNDGSLSQKDIVGVRRAYGSRAQYGDVEAIAVLAPAAQYPQVSPDRLCYLDYVGGRFDGTDDAISMETSRVVTSSNELLGPSARVRCADRTRLSTGYATSYDYTVPARGASVHALPAGLCYVAGVRGALDLTASMSIRDSKLVMTGGSTALTVSVRCLPTDGRIVRTYSWNQNQLDAVPMLAEDEGVCFLTGLAGTFSGGESIEVGLVDGWLGPNEARRPRWFLYGRSASDLDQRANFTRAEATCLSFLPAPPPPPPAPVPVHVAPSGVKAVESMAVARFYVNWSQPQFDPTSYQVERAADCLTYGGTQWCSFTPVSGVLSGTTRSFSMPFDADNNDHLYKFRVCSDFLGTHKCSESVETSIVTGPPGPPPRCPAGWVRCDDLSCQRRASQCDYVAPTGW